MIVLAVISTIANFTCLGRIKRLTTLIGKSKVRCMDWKWEERTATTIQRYEGVQRTHMPSLQSKTYYLSERCIPPVVGI